MSSVNLTGALSSEYKNLFDTCIIKAEKFQLIESITNKLLNNKSRYESVGGSVGIPWYFIAVIHNMESSLNFNKHLHNGDPLTARTVHVPAGRPPSGNPPFTWEESAVDSLRFQKLDSWNDWSLPGLLYKLEAYNGFGYRTKHPEVLSPYLWSFSNHYTSGKYVADGRWSDVAVSNQCGAAVLLRRLAERNEITFPDITLPAKAEGSVIKYSNRKIPYADELQTFLNKVPGIYLKPDGIPGKRTSDAFKKVTGYYLKGDERV